MISFCIALVVLVVGFFTYGKFVEKIFGIDPSRKTPAVSNPDGVDYVPLPGWKIFMIQFLNIAGLGPIFGAIMGAKYGPSSFLWIVFGTIFAGAVHDFMSGMISLRHNGESLPETVGRYLGITAKQVMRVFTVILLILLGVVFVAGPADLLAMRTPERLDSQFWIFVIFAYFILATMFPIDKIIGRVYPIFSIALIFMALGILVMLLVVFPHIPEVTDGLYNRAANPEVNPIFPMLFISIACGAISGFHATQSPLMARCMTNERQGRYIFYGSMVTEGIVALIWAAAATYFFSPEGQSFFGVTDPKINGNSAVIVNSISNGWLGIVGGALAILGVVVAPITSGDTAFRSARLIIADFMHISQRTISKRLLICVPLFIIAILILIYSLSDPDGFEKIWRYFAWSNQTLSVFTLWAITVYLARKGKPYWITLFPAMFMMVVVLTYILFDQSGIGLSYRISIIISLIVVAFTTICFFIKLPKMLSERNLKE
ncbi:MAG: carbon starvation protein A [Porphyromonadaceae bacterium]|nr:carbon starvation protein A [Porphyromonadaceae bacterium]